MQVRIAPTRLSVPSSVNAGPNRICSSEPATPTRIRVPRGRLACVGAAVHELQARLVGDDVADDERDRKLLLQLAEVDGGVLGGDVTGGRDGGLDHEDVRTRFLRDLGEALGALGNRRHDGGPPTLFDLADPT